jgi:hypothetical protein
MEMTAFVTTVAPAGSLVEVGHYDFDGTVSSNEFDGVVDVVVSAVDEYDGSVVSEAWTTLTVGTPPPQGFPVADLTFDWSVEPSGTVASEGAGL